MNPPTNRKEFFMAGYRRGDKDLLSIIVALCFLVVFWAIVAYAFATFRTWHVVSTIAVIVVLIFVALMIFSACSRCRNHLNGHH